MNAPVRALDAIEMRIVVELQRDGRMPTKEIARRVGASEVTVRRRLRRLRSSGAVQIAAAVDPFAVGYQTVASINLKVDPGHLDEIASRLSTHPQVRFVAATLGTWDLLVEFVSTSTHDLTEFLLDDLARTEGIREADTTLILKVYLERGIRGLAESHLAPTPSPDAEAPA